MNRSERRALRKGAKRAVVAKGKGTVELQGGPMNGWLVTPDAAALDPGWGELANQPRGSHYALDKSGTSAIWMKGISA